MVTKILWDFLCLADVIKKKINQVSLPLQGKQMTVSVANDEVGFWLWYVSVISEFF